MVVILGIISSFLHFTLVKMYHVLYFSHKNTKDGCIASLNRGLFAFYRLSIDLYTIIILGHPLRSSKQNLVLRFP